MLDLADHPSWRWHGEPDAYGDDARLIARKDARMNGRVYVRSYTRGKA